MCFMRVMCKTLVNWIDLDFLAGSCDHAALRGVVEPRVPLPLLRVLSRSVCVS